MVIISKDSKQVGKQRNAECSEEKGGGGGQVDVVGPAMNTTAD